jgi:hypothetical protein
MKYRVTEMGFIGRLVRPGEIIEVDGPPPIGGLVPVDDEPKAAQPAGKPADQKPAARAARSTSRAKPPAAPSDEADVI